MKPNSLLKVFFLLITKIAVVRIFQCQHQILILKVEKLMSWLKLIKIYFFKYSFSRVFQWNLSKNKIATLPKNYNLMMKERRKNQKDLQ